MEKTRQKKISRLIQRELSDMLRLAAKQWFSNTLISVTVVRISPDLLSAKAYLSIFPSDKRDEVMEKVQAHKINIRHQLATSTRHQMRKVPELYFYADDSLDYVERIDEILGDDE